MVTSGASQPGGRLPIPTAPNLRDLGGWPTDGGGRVRRGLVFRSAELGRLSVADAGAVAALGITTVYDLRTTAERAQEPDRLPAGVDLVVLDVLADAGGDAAATLAELVADPASLRSALAGGGGARLLEDTYRSIVTLPSAVTAYRTLLGDLARADRRPAVFHCTTGKDRTGWAAAVVLMLLGVPDGDVMADYLLTNDELLPQLAPVFDRFAAAGGDPAQLRPLLGVEPAYLATALAEMRERHGTVERYVTDGLGLPVATIDALRSALVEPA